MHRIGKTPEFGIPEEEPGIFVASINYTPTFETYEQLGHDGEIMGLALYKQKVEIEMSGEVPYEGTGSNLTLGAAVELQNSCPARCWLGGAAPTATTSVLTAAPVTMNREGARECSYSGAIYPFATTA